MNPELRTEEELCLENRLGQNGPCDEDFRKLEEKGIFCYLCLILTSATSNVGNVAQIIEVF